MVESVLIGVLVTILLSWGGWITLSVIDHTKKINSTENKVSNMEAIHEDISEVKIMVKELDTKLSSRFDTFIKQELDELKKIADKEN